MPELYQIIDNCDSREWKSTSKFSRMTYRDLYGAPMYGAEESLYAAPPPLKSAPSYEWWGWVNVWNAR